MNVQPPPNTNDDLLKQYERIAEEKSVPGKNILQLNKDGNQLILTSQNGTLVKFFAATMYRLGVDLYDKFSIGNEQRQNQAAKTFFTILSTKYEYELQNAPTILKADQLKPHLNRSGVISIPGTNLPLAPGTKRPKTVNLGDNLAICAGINNYDDLPPQQRKVLREVHSYWKTSLDKTHSPNEANNLLRETVTNSKPLLAAIVKNPQVGKAYLERCAALEKKLENLLLISTSPTADMEITTELALDLTREFSELAGWTESLGLPVGHDPERNNMSNCALAPAWSAAVKLKSNKDIYANLAAGNKGAPLHALLKAADDYSKAAEKEERPLSGIITETTARDPIFSLCVSLKPIHTCLNAAGVGKSSVFKNSAAYNEISPERALTCWAQHANTIVAKHGMRQALAQKNQDEQFFSHTNIANDIYARESFEHCTGLEWNYLSEEEQQRASFFCMQFALSDRLSGWHVEKHLADNRELIRNLTFNPEMANQFYKTMGDVQKSLSEMVPELTAQDSNSRALAAKYTRQVSIPLIKLAKQLSPRPSFENLTNIAAANTLQRMDKDSITNLGQAFAQEDSNISTLLKTSQSLQQDQDKETALEPPPNIDTADCDEAFGMNPLRVLAKFAELYVASAGLSQGNLKTDREPGAKNLPKPDPQPAQDKTEQGDLPAEDSVQPKTVGEVILAELRETLFEH